MVGTGDITPNGTKDGAADGTFCHTCAAVWDTEVIADPTEEVTDDAEFDEVIGVDSRVLVTDDTAVSPVCTVLGMACNTVEAAAVAPPANCPYHRSCCSGVGAPPNPEIV